MVSPLAMGKPVSPFPALPGMAPKLKEKPSPMSAGSEVGAERARSKLAVKALTTRPVSMTGMRRRAAVEVVPVGGVAVARSRELLRTLMMLALKTPLAIP